MQTSCCKTVYEAACVASAECTTYRQRGYVLTGYSYLRQLTGRGDDVSDGLCATQATMDGQAYACMI